MGYFLGSTWIFSCISSPDMSFGFAVYDVLGLLFPIPTRTSTLCHGDQSFHGFQCGAVLLALYSGFSVFFSLMLVKLMLSTIPLFWIPDI